MATSRSPLDKNGLPTQAHLNETDNQMLARIRLMLALSALLVALVDYMGPSRTNKAAVLVLTFYAAACTVAYVCTRLQLEWPQGKLMHRLDAVMWSALAGRPMSSPSYSCSLPSWWRCCVTGWKKAPASPSWR